MKQDYVLAKDIEGNLLCFNAPKWSGISAGDDVVVDGEIFPVLEAVTLYDDHDKEVINILKMIFPVMKKVESKVFYKEMDYTER